MSVAATTLPLTPNLSAGKPRHMAYGDAVRVLGTIAVVVGHICDMPMLASNANPSTLNWWVCNIADAFSRWAVPIYIMLSGALLLDPARTEPPSVFYRKRLARLGAPLVFWSVFFILFDIFYTGWHTWQSALTNLVLGHPYPHLHFIFRIAILYAFTPMFRIFVRHANRPTITLSVILLFIVWSADSVVNGFLGTSLSAFARFAPFVGYYLAGYLLRESYAPKHHLKYHITNVVLCCSLLAGVSGALCIYYGKVQGYPSVQMFLYDFLSPVRIPMAISAWIILNPHFHFRNPQKSRLARVFSWIAPTTLGLYLIHPMYREILQYPYPLRDFLASHLHLSFLYHFHGIDALWPNVWIGIPLLSLLVWGISLLSVLGLMRIPLVRSIVE